MRILVDVTPLSHPRTGIGNYLRGMVAGLVDAADGRHDVVCFGPTSLPGKRRIEEALAGLPVELRLRFVPFAHAWRTAWSRLGRPAAERFYGRFDVLHFSDWMYPPQVGGLRATTIHDLVPLRFPDWVARRTLAMHTTKYRNTARTCDLVFANSRATAEDVTELLSFPRERIHVAYPGIDPLFRAEGERADLGAPYILSVATLEPRKNLGALVDAFELVRRRRPELELALVGPEGWGERQSLERDGVRLLGYVSDAELASLYRGAALFAYPSRFEGFGIPVVEALACGAPCVVSDHPSLDEACGEAPVRANATRPEELASALERAYSEREVLAGRGVEHARRFTWRACGEAVLHGYQTAL